MLGARHKQCAVRHEDSKASVLPDVRRDTVLCAAQQPRWCGALVLETAWVGGLLCAHDCLHMTVLSLHASKRPTVAAHAKLRVAVIHRDTLHEEAITLQAMQSLFTASSRGM